MCRSRLREAESARAAADLEASSGWGGEGSTGRTGTDAALRRRRNRDTVILSPVSTLNEHNVTEHTTGILTAPVLTAANCELISLANPSSHFVLGGGSVPLWALPIIWYES